MQCAKYLKKDHYGVTVEPVSKHIGGSVAEFLDGRAGSVANFVPTSQAARSSGNAFWNITGAGGDDLI